MLIPFQSPSLFSSSSHQSCARPSELLLPSSNYSNPSAPAASSSSNSSVGSTSTHNSSHAGVEGPAFVPVSGFGYVQKGSHGARCLSSGGGLNAAPTYSSSCSYAYPVCSATILRFNSSNQRHKFARLAACRDVLRRRKVALPGEVAHGSNPFEMSTIITLNAQGVQQLPHLETNTNEHSSPTIMSPYSRSISAQAQSSSLLLSPSHSQSSSSMAVNSTSTNNKQQQQPAPWPPASYFTRLHQAFLAENNNNVPSPSSGLLSTDSSPSSTPIQPPVLMKTQSAPPAMMETEQITVSISPMIGSSSADLSSVSLVQSLPNSVLLSPSSDSLPPSIPVLQQTNSEAPLLRLPSQLLRKKNTKSLTDTSSSSTVRAAASSQHLIARIRARKRLLETRSTSCGTVNLKEMTLLKRKNSALSATNAEWQQNRQTESGGRTSLLRRSLQNHFIRSHSLPSQSTPHSSAATSSAAISASTSSSRTSHSSPSLRASKKMMLDATTSPLHQALTSVAAQVAASGLESLYEEVDGIGGEKSHNTSIDADALNVSTSSIDAGAADASTPSVSADGFQKARSPSKLLEALQKMNHQNTTGIVSPNKPVAGLPADVAPQNTHMQVESNTSSDLSAANDDVLLSFVALAGGLRDHLVSPSPQPSNNDDVVAAAAATPMIVVESEDVPVKSEALAVANSSDERIDSDEPLANSEGDMSTLNATTSSSSSSSSSSSPSIPLLTEHLVVQTTSPSLGSQASDTAGATHVSHDSSHMLSDEDDDDGEEVEYMALGGEMSIELLTDCSTNGTTSPTISPPINAAKPQNEQAKQLFSLLIQS